MRFLKNNTWSHFPGQNVVPMPKIINMGSVVWKLTQSVSQPVSQPVSQSLILLYIVVKSERKKRVRWRWRGEGEKEKRE